MRRADPELRLERERQIIDAAVFCFVENGFHKTSMQQVAATSGLSAGLIYRYFDSKEAIIARVAQLDRDTMILAVDALPDQGYIVGAWAEWLTLKVAEWSAPGTVRLVSEIYAEAGRNAPLHATLEASEAALAHAIARKLARQIETGALPVGLRAGEAALGLLILFDGAVSRGSWQSPSAEVHVTAVIEKLVSALLRAD